MKSTEAARQAFIRAVNGESYLSISIDMGLSRERIRQLCCRTRLIIIEYCFARDIRVPKGRLMSNWRKNSKFWMLHLEYAWNDEKSHLSANRRIGYSLLDTEKYELDKKIHEGDGYIDVELYNLVFSSKPL
jgi:hypothetical protein